MSPFVAIDVDASRNLVRMTLGGFFDVADIEEMARQRDKAHSRLRCGPNRHLTLVDLRQMDIQSQVSVQLFQRILDNPEQRSLRLAFVIARTLARIQLKRAVSTRQASYFETPEEAERWLLEASE